MVMMALVKQESGFRHYVQSKAGAKGLTQLMPFTAKALGVNPDSAYENIHGGTHYLMQQWDRFGSLDKALAAYNAGPVPVYKYGGVPPYPETQRYVANIIASVKLQMAGRPI